MRDNNIFRVLTLLWPPLFGYFCIFSDTDEKHYKRIYFFSLLILLWLFYNSLFTNYLLGYAMANFALLALLSVNYFWSTNISLCFDEKSRKMISNPLVRILLIVLPFSFITPGILMIGYIVEFIYIDASGIPFRLYHFRYINWSDIDAYICAFFAIILSVTQFYINTNFRDFIMNRNECEEGPFDITGWFQYFMVFFTIVGILLSFLLFSEVPNLNN